MLIYSLEVKEEVDKIFKKLAKKNQRQIQILDKKIREIRENPFHEYKFLKHPLQGFNRVHIDKHFVLIFRVDHKNEVAVLYYYAHHDFVYQWRPTKEE